MRETNPIVWEVLPITKRSLPKMRILLLLAERRYLVMRGSPPVKRGNPAMEGNILTVTLHTMRRNLTVKENSLTIKVNIPEMKKIILKIIVIP
jgi:hypothetical protein